MLEIRKTMHLNIRISKFFHPINNTPSPRVVACLEDISTVVLRVTSKLLGMGLDSLTLEVWDSSVGFGFVLYGWYESYTPCLSCKMYNMLMPLQFLLGLVKRLAHSQPMWALGLSSGGMLGSNCKMWNSRPTLEVWYSSLGFIRHWALQLLWLAWWCGSPKVLIKLVY